MLKSQQKLQNLLTFQHGVYYNDLLLEAVKAQYALMGQTIEASASVKIGVYQTIMLATGIVSSIAIAFCEIKNIKD